VANSKINNRFEFKGLLISDNQILFSLFDVLSQKSNWMRIGDKINDCQLVNFDVDKLKLDLKINGDSYYVYLSQAASGGVYLKQIQKKIAELNAQKQSTQESYAQTAIENKKSQKNLLDSPKKQKTDLLKNSNATFVSNNLSNFGSTKKHNYTVDEEASDSVFETDQLNSNISDRYVQSKKILRENKVHNPDKFAQIGAHHSSVLEP
jgi:hypothetical protein